MLTNGRVTLQFNVHFVCTICSVKIGMDGPIVVLAIAKLVSCYDSVFKDLYVIGRIFASLCDVFFLGAMWSSGLDCSLW